MDFQLDDDQLQLQSAMRTYCDGQFPSSRLSAFEGGATVDRATWRGLAEMGVFGLRSSSDAGGVGLETADAVIVFAELGRRLVPGPLLFSHLAADHVAGASDGRSVVGGLDATNTGGRILVEHLAALDSLVVIRPDGIDLIEPASLDAEPIATPLDPLTPVHRVAQLPKGERIGSADAARRLQIDGTALAAALLLGSAEATLELAVAYAQEREQFDRPIGSFQAVKHILADMFVRQEVARAAVYAAGATIDQPDVGDVVRAVAVAKLTAAQAALGNARACIQVHGGMGYTWEVPAHYHLKRSWVLESMFGNSDEHAASIARIFAGDPLDND